MADEISPSPIPGLNMQNYRMFITRALSDPDDRGIPAVFMQWAAQAMGHQGDEKKRTEDFYFFFLQLSIEQRLHDLDALVDRYQQMAAWCHDQAKDERRKMEDAETHLTGINDFLEDADAKYDRTSVIRLLKKRGMNIDNGASDGDLQKLLQQEKGKAITERGVWSKRYDDAKSKADYYDEMEKENLQKAEELVTQREKIRASNYDPADEEQKLREAGAFYSKDIHEKTIDIEQLKKGVPIERIKGKNKDLSPTQSQEDAFMSTEFSLKKTFSSATIPPAISPVTPAPGPSAA